MDRMHQTTDGRQSHADAVPDRADDLRELGDWLGRLAGALDRMPQVQRRALLRATDALRSDLKTIRLGVPEGSR